MTRAAAFIWFALGSAICYCLLRKPLTLYDGIDPIIAAVDAPGTLTLFHNAFHNTAYFRPLRLVQIKLLYDAADGRLFAAYAGFHAVLTLAAVALMAALTRPRSWAGFAGTALAAVVFFGLHTTPVLFLEAYPINHFLEILVLVLLAVYATARLQGLAAGLVVTLSTAIALLTLESGVLVWVAVTAAWVLGWRGLSWRWLAATSSLLIAYFALRVFFLDIGTPGLTERSSGFGLTTLDPPELVARFGDNPWPFYLYNVVTSWLSVLAAEPRNGTWGFVSRVLEGEVAPFMVINLVTSLLTTALIVGGTATALAAARHRALTDRHRLLLLFWVVCGANGALSFAYTKDVIMSPAGAFYALAACAAVSLALEKRGATPALVVLCVVLSVGWTSRTAGLVYGLRYQAFRQANDWVFMEDVDLDALSPQARLVIERLRRQMVAKAVPPPNLVQSRTLERWIDQSQ